MDHGRALILAEKHCYIAAFNRHYGNPPSEKALLDCITAGRRVPCDLCLRRSGRSIDFLSSPGSTFSPLTFTPPSKSARGGQKLMKDKKDLVESMLLSFRDTLRSLVAGQRHYRNYLGPMFLSYPVSSSSLACSSSVIYIF
jgi:hypothetical protein